MDQNTTPAPQPAKLAGLEAKDWIAIAQLAVLAAEEIAQSARENSQSVVSVEAQQIVYDNAQHLRARLKALKDAGQL